MSLPVILALLALFILWIATSSKDRLARFWKYPTKSPVNKYPTIEDIRRKYPKRVTQEQLRRQARAKDEADAKRKQEIIDRNIKEVRSAKESNLEKAFQPIRNRDISISNFRMLIEMVNGQEDVARRLIEGNLKLFPDKSPDWACEKAISDIERDRRI
jgi:hypothetical protein